ncbi:GAF domain-containing protein [Pseudoduganella sp. OTU4001]|uniref:GAF domain-containing protein n=1 Tax=Pseudoduganella sp. OTU4001 TaxID=3043854 RepID=UPI00313E67D4
MSDVTLDTIRECFEGVVPAVLGTAGLDGMPNASYLSQVQYMDREHVALSYQFFNKTRVNILANPHARLTVINPYTGAQYSLALQYLRTETSGQLFESMKAKLAGLASHTGMSGVFKLLGSDVFRVTEIVCVDRDVAPPPPPPRNLLAALRLCSERLLACRDLAQLFDETMACLDQKLGISHAMLLLHDPAAGCLYTVASHGYEQSGVGSEIPLGQGVIGVAAREGTPIRISHMTAEYSYSRAIRQQTEGTELAQALQTEIPYPGLAESRSQLAVPIQGCERLLGVLYVESPQDLRFTYDDEDALVTLCGQLAMAMHILQNVPAPEPEPEEQAAPHVQGVPLVVRHYADNDCVFFGNDYLIKGVAGAVLWALLQDFVAHGKTAFCNRELRLDQRVRLPDVSDNLEARLVLLARRLCEREAPVRIEKTGRGHFRLCVERPLQLAEG